MSMRALLNLDSRRQYGKSLAASSEDSQHPVPPREDLGKGRNCM